MKTQRILIPLALLFLAACSGPRTRTQLDGSGMDMFAPVSFRIHPLTRVTPGELQARLEFTDQMDDVTKAVGQIAISLYVYELAAIGHRGRQIGQWDADLLTLSDNEAYWDPITRTYLFKYPLDPDAIQNANGFVVSAKINFSNNTSLQNQTVVR